MVYGAAFLLEIPANAQLVFALFEDPFLTAFLLKHLYVAK